MEAGGWGGALGHKESLYHEMTSLGNLESCYHENDFL